MGISENADSPLLCSREIKLMQYPKDDIQKEILKAAEKVFLENGFPKASMREIAQEAQVGLSNIYNYFKNKDDIFCTVVRPVISAFDRMLHEHHGRYGADIMEMYSSEYLRCVIEEYMTLYKSIANCWYCYFSMHRVLHWKTSKRTSPNAPHHS